MIGRELVQRPVLNFMDVQIQLSSRLKSLDNQLNVRFAMKSGSTKLHQKQSTASTARRMKISHLGILLFSKSTTESLEKKQKIQKRPTLDQNGQPTHGRIIAAGVVMRRAGASPKRSGGSTRQIGRVVEWLDFITIEGA